MNRQPDLFDEEYRLLYAKDSDTSRDAALSVQEVAGRLRAMVYGFIFARGLHGATCDEAEVVLELRHQTCSARFNELRNTGFIIETERRRLTRSGRKAAVYVAKVIDDQWRELVAQQPDEYLRELGHETYSLPRL